MHFIHSSNFKTTFRQMDSIFIHCVLILASRQVSVLALISLMIVRRLMNDNLDFFNHRLRACEL